MLLDGLRRMDVDTHQLLHMAGIDETIFDRRDASLLPEQVEAIVNSGAPHVLPKLISDQQFFVTKEWASLFETTQLIGNMATAVTTLVQGVKNKAGGAAAGKKPAPKAKLADEERQELRATLAKGRA